MENLDFSMSVLRKDEEILASLNCNLKSFIDFSIVDKDGVLFVTNERILFCESIGKSLSAVHSFDYKLITSLSVKENDDRNKYIIFRYNGDRVKITKIAASDEEILKASEIIYKKQTVL